MPSSLPAFAHPLHAAPGRTVRAGDRATGREGHGPQLRADARTPGARSGETFLERQRSAPRTLRCPARPRSEEFLHALAAIGRVAALEGGSGASPGLSTPPEARQRPGGASASRRTLQRWTRQQTLPRSCPVWEECLSTQIDIANALAGVSTRIYRDRSRRGKTAPPLISSCISAEGAPSGSLTTEMKRPRSARTLGALTGSGDD